MQGTAERSGWIQDKEKHDKQHEALDGYLAVTRDMIGSWCEALDRDEGLQGWENRSVIIYGKQPPHSKHGADMLPLDMQ